MVRYWGDKFITVYRHSYVCGEQQARFCPECLKEAPYHRLAWMLIPAAVCLEHECLLVARCPECLKPLSVRSVVHRRCVRCEADLLQARSQSVAGDIFGLFAQRVIQAWLGLVPMPKEPQPYSLPDQPPEVLFQVMEGLRRNLSRAGDGWSYLHRVAVDPAAPPPPSIEAAPRGGKMSPSQAYCAFATAFKGIVNWPDGFHEFLDAFRSRGKGGLRQSIYASLGALYSKWVEGYWTHPAYGFVQEAFNQYLAERYAILSGAAESNGCHDNPDLGNAFQYADLRGAAKMLGASAETIMRLVRLGRLTYYKGQTPPFRNRRFFRRADILALRLRWHDSMSLKDAARQLGVSEKVVVDMVEVGLLKAEHNPSADDGNQWLFTNSAVEECVARILHGCGMRKSADRLINLSAVAQLAGNYNAARALRRVAHGELRGWWLADSVGNVGNLLFKWGDVIQRDGPWR